MGSEPLSAFPRSEEFYRVYMEIMTGDAEDDLRQDL